MSSPRSIQGFILSLAAAILLFGCGGANAAGSTKHKPDTD